MILPMIVPPIFPLAPGRPTLRRAVSFLAGALTTALVACAPISAPAQSPTVAPSTPAPAPTAALAASPRGNRVATIAIGSMANLESVLGVHGSFDGEAKRLEGAGATFPAPLYTKWFDRYNTLTGVTVTYQAIGSGSGIQSISEQTVDFGASDAPLSDEQLKQATGGRLLHIPTALGGVIPTYNVPGVTAQLRFTPDVLAAIYLGQITRWNDPRLVTDNPTLANVNQPISVFHRSDGSGTTYIFTDYLSNVSTGWSQSVGNGTTVRWPVGTGEIGNPGVAGAVGKTPYSIGYVELAYAQEQHLGVGLVKNRAGKFVEASLQTISTAAANAAGAIAPDLRAHIVNAPGDNAYPISGFTYQLVYQTQTDRAKAMALARLLWWEIHDGQEFNSSSGYAPLPPAVVQKDEEQIKSLAFPSS